MELFARTASNMSRYLILLVCVSLLAGMVYSATYKSPLPTVTFSQGPIRQGVLIAHSNGYWYVIRDTTAQDSEADLPGMFDGKEQIEKDEGDKPVPISVLSNDEVGSVTIKEVENR